MDEWAIVKAGDHLYRLRRGSRSDGEPRIVAEMVDPNVPASMARTMTLAANQPFEELRGKYIPHLCHAIAKALAKHIRAEVIDHSKPPPIDPDSPERFVVY